MGQENDQELLVSPDSAPRAGDMWGALETSSTPSSGEVPDPERFLDTLARVDDLRVPSSVARAGGGVGFAGRRAYLSDSFSRDPAVFLERHGDAVAVEHLALFDHLREDYEVDFHLRRLAASACPVRTKRRRAKPPIRTSRHARTRGLLHGGRHATARTTPLRHVRRRAQTHRTARRTRR